MPIVGLTDSEAVGARLSKLGDIRKGIRHPDGTLEDLDYFRFIPKDGPHKEELMDIWLNVYGPRPTSIEFFLLHDEIEDNWSTWMEAYGYSGLKFRCNGKYWVQWQNDDLTYTRDYDLAQKRPCPYCSGQKPRTREDPGDVPVGYLNIMLIPFVEHGFVGVVTVHTTSVHDLANISANLKYIYEQNGGSLRGIPLNLMRVLDNIGTRYRSQDGKWVKSRADKWMIHIEPNPTWLRNKLKAQYQQALAMSEPGNALPPLGNDVDVGDVEMHNSIPDEVIEASVSASTKEPVHEEKKQAGSDRKKKRDKPYTPQELQDAVTKAVSIYRENGFSYSNSDDRSNYEWKIGKYLNELAGPHAGEVLEFIIGESDFTRMDDAEVETLRRYFATRKVDGEWKLDDVVVKEIAAVLGVVRASAEGEGEGDGALHDDEEQKEDSFFIEDVSALSLQERRKYATKLYQAARERGLNPPSYTDDTIEWFVVAVEKMLRDAGVS